MVADVTTALRPCLKARGMPRFGLRDVQFGGDFEKNWKGDPTLLMASSYHSYNNERL